MQDLSSLAKDSMWVSSQAGGNRQSSNELAMTAAGSPPVDPEVPADHLSDPHVSATSDLPVGTSGKPQASGQSGAYKPGPPRWKPTTVPDVIRKAPKIIDGQGVPRS